MKRKSLEKYVEACWLSACRFDELFYRVESTDQVLRREFIAHRLILKAMEIEELLTVHRALWSNDSAWRVSYEDDLSKLLLKFGELGPLAKVIAREERPIFIPSEIDQIQACLSFLQQLRNFILFSSLQRDQDELDLIQQSINGFFQAMRSMSVEEKFILERSISNFLTNSFLPLSILSYGSNDIGERYSSFGKSIQILRGFSDMNTQDLDKVLERKDLSSTQRDRVREIIEGIQDVLEGVSLDELGEILSDDGNVPPICEDGDVTLIPGNRNDSCRPIVLAIASTSIRGRGLYTVLRQVRSHLIDCFHVVQIVIVITDRWNPKDWIESEGDFIAHDRNLLHRKVLLPILCVNRQLTAISWP